MHDACGTPACRHSRVASELSHSPTAQDPQTHGDTSNSHPRSEFGTPARATATPSQINLGPQVGRRRPSPGTHTPRTPLPRAPPCTRPAPARPRPARSQRDLYRERRATARWEVGAAALPATRPRVRRGGRRRRRRVRHASRGAGTTVAIALGGSGLGCGLRGLRGLGGPRAW